MAPRTEGETEAWAKKALFHMEKCPNPKETFHRTPAEVRQ